DLGSQKPDLSMVAAKTRDYFVSSAGDFQPEVARSIAELLYAHILDGGSPPGPVNELKPIADDARAYIIDLGAKFSSGQVLKSAPAQLIQILEKPAEGGEDLPPAHLLQVRTASSRPAPAIGPGAVRVFVSETGANALVSWTGKDRVFYRDSQGNGWSDVRELKLSDGFDLNQAYDVLDQRVQNR